MARRMTARILEYIEECCAYPEEYSLLVIEHQEYGPARPGSWQWRGCSGTSDAACELRYIDGACPVCRGGPADNCDWRCPVNAGLPEHESIVCTAEEAERARELDEEQRLQEEESQR